MWGQPMAFHGCLSEYGRLSELAESLTPSRALTLLRDPVGESWSEHHSDTWVVTFTIWFVSIIICLLRSYLHIFSFLFLVDTLTNSHI